MAEEFTDISSHQAGADIGAYAAAGRYGRILVKATEGTGYVNPYFAAWWRAAGRLGLARGAYHFARPSRAGARSLAGPDGMDVEHRMGDGYRLHREEDDDAGAGRTSAVASGVRADRRSVVAAGVAEADRFLAVVRAAGGLGPRDWLCLDAEDPGERGSAAAVHAAAFAYRLAGEGGVRRGVVYSYGPYLAGCGLTADMLPEGWRWLHIANYGPVPDGRVPLPPGWGRDYVVARQYTESARVPGVPGGADCNRVVREWAGAPVPAEEDDMALNPQERDLLIRDIAAAVRGEVSAHVNHASTDGGTLRWDAIAHGSGYEALGVGALWAYRAWESSKRVEAGLVAAAPAAAEAMAAPPDPPSRQQVVDAIRAERDPAMLAAYSTATADGFRGLLEEARSSEVPPQLPATGE